MELTISISDMRSREPSGRENEGLVPEEKGTALLTIPGSLSFLGAGVGLERVWSLLVGVLRIRF